MVNYHLVVDAWSLVAEGIMHLDYSLGIGFNHHHCVASI